MSARRLPPRPGRVAARAPAREGSVGAEGRLRVGGVPYLVGRPLSAGLGDEAGLSFRTDVPAALIEDLRSGELDVALVSSVELFRRPGYQYLDGPVVAGDGHVSSVQLFLRRPLDEVTSVALDPASRTSAALTRALLAELHGLAPDFVEVEPGADPRAAGTDAWLRIGDPALAEAWAPGAPETFNPSAAWRGATGLPFVFAVWVARPGVDLARWAPAFERAARRGRARLAELAAEAARELELPEPRLHDYLARECRFDVGADLERSLAAFRARLLPSGLVDPACRPTPVQGASRVP